jgi:hypothetical protein
MRAANLRAVETLITSSASDEAVVPRGALAEAYGSELRFRRSTTAEKAIARRWEPVGRLRLLD